MEILFCIRMIAEAQDLFQHKDHLSMYGDSHDKDKTDMRPSYLCHHGENITGKTILILKRPLDMPTLYLPKYAHTQKTKDRHFDNILSLMAL